jgi:SAM-dependent methyltransferase
VAEVAGEGEGGMTRVRDATAAAAMLRDGRQWPTMSADLRRMVPRWHFDMLADSARNRALVAAIEQLVQPDDLVLDIGTGAGLTALAAARVGAQVITCEANPVVAELARQVCAANGYPEIKVLALPSTELEIPKHLPRRADVLVAEVFDSDLFSEGAVPTFNDARERLLVDAPTLIPHAATVWCRPVHSPALHALNRVGTVEGFDLSAFNRAATDGVMYASVSSHDWYAMGSPLPLLRLRFDLPIEPASGVATFSGVRGTVHALVVWMELSVGDACLSNAPGERSHWKQAVYGVDACDVDGPLTVVWSHDTRRLSIGLEAKWRTSKARTAA